MQAFAFPLTSLPRPSPRPAVSRRPPTALASPSLDSDYLSLEGFSSPQTFLPNAIIYSSLRRRLERSALAAALEFFAGLAAAARESSPREVVAAVLDAISKGDGKGVVKLASRTNPLRNVEEGFAMDWIASGELSALIGIESYFVAPNARNYSPDRRACVVGCVVSASDGTKRAVSFQVSKEDEGEGRWLIDSVALD